MKISSTSIRDGEPIPTKYAFGKYDADSHVALAENVSPQLSWQDLPEGTKSIAIICHDDKVPSKPDDVNQEGKTVPADLPRVDFYHWTAIDLDPTLGSINEGAFGSGIVAKGKEGPNGPFGSRLGLNNYTQWFEGNDDMQGKYYGFDGPCPPWNDSIIHNYFFTVYALDVDKLNVEGDFYGPDAIKAMEGHILEKAVIKSTYTINPEAK